MKFLALLTVLLSVPAFAAKTNECKEQFGTYCECTENWGAYSLELVIINLTTNEESRRAIGKTSYTGDLAKVFCEKQIEKLSICK